MEKKYFYFGRYSNRNYCCSIGCHLLDYIPPIESMHQIPVDTIIVYIKTNTIAIITLKSITFSIVFWEEF